MISKNQAEHRRNVWRSSLRTTLFFESFVLLSITVLSISTVAFFLSWNELKVQTIAQLQSMTEGKEALLESTVSRQREQLSTLGRAQTLRNVQSVTTLLGFRQLLQVDDDENITVIAGEKNELPITKDILQTMYQHEGTFFRPIVTKEGWTLYIITAPRMNGTVRIGTLIAIFDATGLAALTLNADSASKTMEILLATSLENEELVLRADDTSGHIMPVLDTEQGAGSMIHDALSGNEGIIETVDYSGIPVLASYRSIPTLGWAVIAKVDLYEVQSPTIRLAMQLAGSGFMIIVFLSFSMYLLGRRIVGPLEELTKKIDGLETKRWRFERSIFTGNELEIVDSAADELTKRLRKAHEHLESLVAERTQELQKQHAEDAAILQSMDDGLVVTNTDGIITYMNEMAENLTSRKDALGKTAEQVLVIADKDGNILDPKKHPITEVLSTSAPFRPAKDPQLTLRKQDGTQTAFQIRVTPILKGKRCFGSVAVIRDVTEERRIDHMKSEFISLVSHQLRTPLSSMRWYLEMLLSEDAGVLSVAQHEYVDQVAHSNTRMVHLVNALLNVSRIELGKFQVSPDTIDFGKLMQTVTSSFDLELQQKELRLVFDMPKRIISIRSDQGLLKLILENFVSNAIKYSFPKSTIFVRLSEDTSESTLRLSVTNTGIGIPDMQKQQIGLKLFRGSNAKTSDTDGNGLGLYISRIAAETIGATFMFESTEGKDTTFTLVIPFASK